MHQVTAALIMAIVITLLLIIMIVALFGPWSIFIVMYGGLIIIPIHIAYIVLIAMTQPSDKPTKS